MITRVRKAVVAGFWGGLSAAGAGFVFTGAPTKDQVAQLFGLFLSGAVVTGFATWKTKPNAPAVSA